MLRCRLRDVRTCTLQSTGKGGGTWVDWSAGGPRLTLRVWQYHVELDRGCGHGVAHGRFCQATLRKAFGTPNRGLYCATSSKTWKPLESKAKPLRQDQWLIGLGGGRIGFSGNACPLLWARLSRADGGRATNRRDDVARAGPPVGGRERIDFRAGPPAPRVPAGLA